MEKTHENCVEATCFWELHLLPIYGNLLPKNLNNLHL